ncbi:acetolactate synthase large subunit [Corynebacterium pyruviciproducens]|uniref:Acetolactate synthase n=4 Tax=Corynebacterium pyruviciproducens TaxID=598660 RepID=A0AAF1BXJ3_9CORY|nr:acetolactate synthase large subunit [Corynebacterium pyruviciproducens]MDK6565110.1 acetolactate synthase large subunit [Corynebacterium pyruviciproducens]MDK7213953.1 acetolactate synthase large subunit [Corynebacterium pyruviciproducens]WOT03502.1 acetolactate synthase large subunit [Corynebacterium pyruviciproducens]
MPHKLKKFVAGKEETTKPVTMTGAEAVVRSLEELGVDTIFGIPGGAVLPLYDPLYSSTSIRHILVRHEQGAGHAAEGYATASGKVGVCIATSGPGATNIVTALADANLDSVPIVAITGQVGTGLLGTDAFQEADTRGITMPVTKHNMMVQKAEDIPRMLAEAFHIAASGRPGPVLVDIPKDVQNATVEFSWPPQMNLPGYHPVTEPHKRQIAEAVELIAQSSQPVLYIGGGVIKANAHRQLRTFAEYTGIPVVTTLMALGSMPKHHPLNMGMPGMHGTVPANAALQRSDLIVAIGTRFDDRVTGDVDSFAPHAKIIHADIDPAEISKIKEVDVPIVGDAAQVLDALLAAYKGAGHSALHVEKWMTYLTNLQRKFPLGYEKSAAGELDPQFVLEKIAEEVGPDAIYVAGVGQHQMWSAQFLELDKPRTWLNSGGLGTMGYCVPAALGAKAACPDKEVWAIDGDGCFQMTNQELATAAIEGLPLKVAIINNGNLGMVRQWQTLFYEERYSNTHLGDKGSYIPDFVLLAQALGCVGLRVEKEEDVAPALRKAREITDRPVVIDFIVSENAQVWPMVAAGASNSDIEYARGLRPLFDEDAATARLTAIDAALEAHKSERNSDHSDQAAPGPAPKVRNFAYDEEENNG